MEPKYLELLHSYIDSGYSTNQAAEKLYYDGEYEGSLNDLYSEANAYHDLKKKEQNEFLQDTSDAGALIGERTAGLELTSGLDDTSLDVFSQQKTPEVEQGPVTQANDLASVGAEYQKRLEDETKAAVKDILMNDAGIAAQFRDIDKTEGKSDAWKQDKKYSLIGDQLHSRTKDLQVGYAEELRGRLGEDVDFEDYADGLWKNFGLTIPLDGDQRYNEWSGGGFLGAIGDAVVRAGASTVDWASGALALGAAALQDPRITEAEGGFGSAVMKFDQKLDDAAQYARDNWAMHYEDSIGEAFAQGHVGEIIMRGTGGLADSAPYMLGALTPVGMVAQGVNATANTYIDSKREDLNRAEQGLDTLFDESPSGEVARAAYSVIDGTLTGVSGGVQARVSKRALEVFKPKNAHVLGLGMREWFKAQGIDLTLEEVTEITQTSNEMAWQQFAGNADYTMDEYGKAVAETALQTLATTGSPVVIGGVAKGARAGYEALKGNSSLITAPQAALNSPAERVKAVDDGGTSETVQNLNTPMDVEGMVSGYEKAKRQDEQTRGAFYQMLAVRHPKAMDSLKSIDIALAKSVNNYRFLKDQEGAETAVQAEEKRIADIVRQREALLRPFEGESTSLSSTETRQVEDGRIARSVEALDNDVTLLRDNLESQEEALGTESAFEIHEGALQDAQERLGDAKRKQAEARRLLGELGQARQAAEDARQGAATEAADLAGSDQALEAERKAEEDLRALLGLSPVVDQQVEVEQAPRYDAAKQLEAHNADPESKGSSFTPDGRNLLGQPKFTVSIFPERSKIIEGDVTEQALIDYKEENKDLLDENADVLAIGTWFDSESNQTYLDVSVALDRDNAIQLGREYNQKAVFDLQNKVEVETGGTGEATGDMKPETDRVADIRKMVAAPEAKQQLPEVEERKEKESKDKQKEVQQDSDLRGIEGQFKENTSKADGTITVLPSKFMPKRLAKFINQKVMPTLRASFGDKGYKIVEHNTIESGNRADRKGDKNIAGYAVDNADGTVEIHLNLPLIQQLAQERGKSEEAIVLEEVFHVLFSRALMDANVKNPKAAETLLEGMMAIARDTGDAALIERVEAKMKLYREAGFDEVAVRDEAAAEIVAEVFGYDYAQKPKLRDKIRTLINKFMRDFVGRDALMITDVTSADQIMVAFRDMVTTGRAVKVAPDAANSSTVERAAMSPSKLPENEPFTMVYLRAGMDKFGGPMPSVSEIRTFNGKWHFINWWNQQRKPGSKVSYSSFNLYDPETQKVGEAVNADVMYKWNLKPPVNKEMQARENDRAKKTAYYESGKKINEARGSKAGWSDTDADIRSGLQEIMNEDQLARLAALDEKVENGELRKSQADRAAILRIATVDQLTSVLKDLETKFGIEGDAIVERAMLDVVLGIRKEGKTRADFDKLLDSKRDALCAMGAGTCSVNDRTSLLQFVSNQMSNMLGGNPSFEESVGWAAEKLQFTLDYLREVEGIDAIDTVGQFERGRDAFFDKLRKDPEIDVNPSDYETVYTLLVSYFSNGSTLDPNLHLAGQVFRAGLKRVQTGSNLFISPDRIKAIAEGRNDSILPSVRGERQKAVASHLSDINEIVKTYASTGVFNKEQFMNDVARKGESKTSPLASMIGKNTWKLSELALGLMGDPKAIPMDSHMRDQVNIAMGKFEDSSRAAFEGMVVPTEVRVGVVNKMNALGFEANTLMSDPELFGVISKMKQSGDNALVARGKELYRAMTGNVTRELRDMNADEIKQARQLVTAVAKKMGVTPFQAQQLMYMDGVYSWSSYQGKPFVSDYESGIKRSADQDLTSINADGLPGEQVEMNFAQDAVERAAIETPTPGRKFLGAMSGVTRAEANQLYRERSSEQATNVVVRGNTVKVDEKTIQDALSTDAASKRIMAKGVEVEQGRKVGVRLNLNVMKNTGVPVQTMHEKTASGEALQYAGAVTVKNATLYVNPEARKKIATFQENKFPMASVNGEFVSSDIDGADYNGVKASFNPFLQGAFVDAAGRPIKSAEEATIIGGDVYLRGEIEYFSANDAKLLQGSVESEKNRESRTKRGPKYDKALSRFEAYAERQLGMTFDSREALEAAYDNMNLPNETALTDSEVAANSERAVERAAIDSFVGSRMRKTASRVGQTIGDLDVRARIKQDPKNYIIPQKLNELRKDIQDLTDVELIDIVTDTQLGKLSQMNDNLSVLAQAEILSRAVARGETGAIPGIVAELAAMGTSAGRILRHLREVKSSTPKGMADFIRAEVESKGNKLTEDQEVKLKDLTSRMFEAHAVVEDLMTRAANGENVGKELKEAEARLKQIEREMDTFTNVVIERGWGQLLGQIAQGNLLTTMSQVTNIGANSVNAFLDVFTDAAAAPFKWMGQALATLAGKELNFDRQQSLSAHLYAMSRMGGVFAQTAREVATGRSEEVTEWTMSRSLMPYRSLLAAFKGQLPEKSSKLAAINQRAKLFVQGTLGVPAEAMFRLLSLGDTPFRKYFEHKSLYEMASTLGLEGDALTDFLKHPPRKYQEKARAEGRKITFQEETPVSKVTQQAISGAERLLASAMAPIKGINGQEFSKFLMRLLIPFRSTPANILYETATYASPVVGAMRISSDLSKGNVDDAVHNLGKVIVGAAVTETALMLLSEGLISGVLEWNDDEEKNLAYDQFPPTSLNVSALQRLINGEDPAKQEDDFFANYMKLGTPGALMAATVKAYTPEDIKEREYGGPVDFATYALRDMFGVGPMAAAGTMLQQSFLQGMNDFLQLLVSGEYEKNSEKLLKGVMNVGLSIGLPNQMSAQYRAQREYLPDRRITKDMSMTERVMKNVEYTVKDRTFGGSEIPIRIDWKGNPIKQNPRGNVGWFYQLFDITKMRQGEADSVSQEIYRLFEQTDEISKVVSTPAFAKKRKVSVPDIVSKKERRALKREYNKDYTFLEDKEFTEGGVYFNTEQMNRLMAIAGKERYAEVDALMRSFKYQNMSDSEKLEALEEVNDSFNSIKEYDGSRFKKHTIAIFDIMQEIYDNERAAED